MNGMRLSKKIAVAMCFAFLALAVAAGESKETYTIKIDQVLSGGFPDVTAFAVITNSKDDPAAGLSPGLFRFRIDSMEYKIKSTVVPFSMKEMPIDYTILFSNSGVMDGEPLDFQKNAILQFIDMMKPIDTLSVYAIGEEAVPVFETQKKDAIDVGAINKTTVSSAQPRVYDSMVNVMRKVSLRKTTRKVVIIISDGRDQNSRFTSEQLDSVLVETGVPVYSIGFKVLTSQSLSNLNEISDRTGGTYIFAYSVRSIPDTLKKIVGRVTQCYILDFHVRGLKADDLPHHLEVIVDAHDAYGKGEKTFVAVKVPVPKWVKWVVVGIILLVIILLIVLKIVLKIRKRRRMGITRRKCPVCHARQKDGWDTCPFCKYLPESKKKKKKGNKDD